MHAIFLVIIKRLSLGILHFLALIEIHKDDRFFIDLTTNHGFNFCDFCHSSWGEIVYQCSLNFYISSQWDWTSFLRVGTFAFNFLWVLCSIFLFTKKMGPLVFFLVCFRRSLHIKSINTLVNIFPCLSFVFLICSWHLLLCKKHLLSSIFKFIHIFLYCFWTLTR